MTVENLIKYKSLYYLTLVSIPGLSRFLLTLAIMSSTTRSMDGFSDCWA